jgi:scyllo-inositol 2-dehydrogenase (NAD+)
MQELGIGVVGLGRLGYVHARNISQTPRARLIAVCDQQEKLARQVAQELNCVWYADVRRMLENRDIQAVCVVTPTAHHVGPVAAVVRAEKPLFCEKPLAGSLEDTLRLADLIKDSGITCQIGFQRRFDPPHAEAQRMIQRGEIGRPVYINGFSRDPFPPPPWACDPSRGGGLYIDFLLHDFDMARFLMNDEVESVFASEANLVVDSEGIEGFADNALVTLRFKGGALASYHASMHAGYGYDIRTEIFGSKGNLMIGDLHRVPLTRCTREGGISKPFTFQGQGKLPHFMVRFKEAYALEMKAFVDCVLDKAPAPINEEDALRALRIAVAAGQSARQGVPVKLDA